jgi:hypothetical protein
MIGLDKYDKLYVSWSLFFHIALITLFAIRKINLELIYQNGWIFYALSIPAAFVSIIILRGGKPVSFWLAGFIFLAWAVLGFVIEFVVGIEWRDPILWPIFVPYVLLYLATFMFYWWPVGQLVRPLWFLYAAFFALSTYLNVSSH